MKAFDRLSLIDRIGRELMSYADIRTYLDALGIDTAKPTSGVNSKWVYTKELLATEPEAKVLEIADELGIPHRFAVTADSHAVESTFWEPLHFRLFLSHLSSFKKTTATLQSALRRYGISAFVAHVDIEPTKEWQDEIEAALFSMDALAAILMPGFKESNWTDQEVGVAVGRGVLIVPVIRGLNPYGFIGKYQGLRADGRTVQQVAQEVYSILAWSPKTRSRMLSCLVDTTLQAASAAEALEKLRHLDKVVDLPHGYLEKLRDGAATGGEVSDGEPLAQLNEMLSRRGLTVVEPAGAIPGVSDDDVPF